MIGCLLIPLRAFGQFGVSGAGGFYTVDTGAGLVFKVNQSNGDVPSIKYNGIEYNDTGTASGIASGLGTPTTVTASNYNNQYIMFTCQTGPNNGVVSNLTQYLIVTNGCNTIFMGTYVVAEPAVGELRWITRLQSGIISNGPAPSDLRGNTGAIESSDIFGMADGTTRSKYYGDGTTHGKDRAFELTYYGATNPPIPSLSITNGIGVFMVYDSPRESSSGGPFFRDIQNQCGTDQEIYNYMNSGHNQTEAYRNNVLHGPYALVFTTGSPPTMPYDYTWIETSGLSNNITGYVGKAARGNVKGTVSGIPGGFQAVVGFANTAAQYWAVVSTNGTYTTPLMKPGTYTVILYKGELGVTTNSVTVLAGQTSKLNLASDEANPSTVFRIGQWDSTPNGFLNSTNVATMSLPNNITMHPQDVRNASWGPVTFTVGADPDSKFPAIQFRGVNSPTTVLFNLTSGQITNMTLRIGASCAYNNGRASVTVNGFSTTNPGPPGQPSSRSFTLGTYRGNNVLWTYSIPPGDLLVGQNTISISPISGSGDLGPWLSAGWAYDAVELDYNTNTVALAAPTGLVAAPGDTQVALTWNTVSGATGYNVRNATVSGGPYSIVASNIATTSYIDSSVVNGTLYYYVVSAVNSTAESVYSSEVNATPVAAPSTPSGLTATAVSACQINLAWSDNATNETNYLIERSPDGVTFAQIANVVSNTTSYSDVGLAAGTTYYYRVRANSLDGLSGYSNTAHDTTQAAAPPTAPTGLTATPISTSEIDLAWTDNSNNEDGFYIERSLDGINFTQIASVSANVVTYQDLTGSAGTTYYYRVRSFRVCWGNSGYTSTASATTLPPPLPAAPVGLTAMAGDTQLTLTWVAASGATGYNVKRALVSGGPYSLIGNNVTTTSYVDSGLVDGTTYFYVVSSLNAFGEGANSSEAVATPVVTTTAYWNNKVVTPAQSWNVNGNWTNTAVFPNAPGVLVWMNNDITFIQTNNLSQAITVGWLNIGDLNATHAYNLRPNGGSLTLNNGVNGAGVFQLSTSKGDTIAAPLTLASPTTVGNKAANNATFTLSGNITGTNALAVVGPSSVTLAGTNSYSGPITISGGTAIIGLNSTLNLNALGTSNVTFYGGGLQFFGYAASTTPEYGGNTNNLVVPTGQTANLFLPVRFTSPGLAGTLTGGGTLSLFINYVRGNISGVWSNFTGQVRVLPGSGATPYEFRLGNLGFPNGALYLTNVITMYNIGGNNRTIDIGELSGVSGAVIGTGSANSTSPTWRVGGKNTSATFAGQINDAGVTTVIKVGSGAWTLTGANGYSGGTTVSSGTLLVNNTTGSGTGAGAVTVASGATLGGKGVITGPVTVNGTLLPGGTVLGTLTVSNNLVVNNGAVLQYALGAQNDLAVVTGNLTLGGTLNVVDAGGFGPGNYTLLTYPVASNFVYNGVSIGTTPPNLLYTVNTNTVGLVKLVVANPVPAVAGFSASPTNGATPLTVNFIDASTGSITNWFWDFGDGNTTNFVTATNPAHTYTPGTYTVSLIVTGQGGISTNVQSNAITVLTLFATWQQQYFGCTNCPQADANADPDGDGQNNLDEFLAGTNPTNGMSGLQIISTDEQGNDVNITWTTAGGRTNAVQATAGDLEGAYDTNFSDISGPIAIPGSGDATTNYLDAGGVTDTPTRYYRIRLVP